MRLALTGKGESSNYYPATCSVGVLLFFLCSLALLPVCVLNHFPHRGYKLEARPPEDHSRRESHSSVTHSTLVYTIHFTFTPLFCFALFLKRQDSAKPSPREWNAPASNKERDPPCWHPTYTEV